MNKAVDYRKSYAYSSCGTVPVFVGLIHSLCHGSHIGAGHADARIADLNGKIHSIFTDNREHMDVYPSVFCKLYRIVQKMPEELPYLPDIPLKHGRSFGSQINYELQIVFFFI